MGCQLNEYMEKAFAFEENGYVDEALQLCEKCLKAFPEYEDEIAFEIAKMNYRNGNLEIALLQFLELYNQTEDISIIDLVLDAYYYSNAEKYNMLYHENWKEIEHYPYYFGEKKESDKIRFCPLLVGKSAVYYYDNLEKGIKSVAQPEIKKDKLRDLVCAAADLLRIEEILLIEKLTRKSCPFMDNENAFLLVYQEETWELFLQLVDISELSVLDRIVLFDSMEKLEEALVYGEADFPAFLISNNVEKIDSLVMGAYQKNNQKCLEYEEKVCKYYDDNAEMVLKHIEDGRPKILFFTSRYTTALQYHTRDCMEAAERMGIHTKLMIEPNRMQLGLSYIIALRFLAEFKPDIVFVIDHFRFEYKYFIKLKSLVCIGWVQDPMDSIMDLDSPGKLGPRDIVMTHYTTWRDFQELGYDKRRVIEAPIPADSHIYKKYELTESEKVKYSCDICLVCHAADVEGYIEKELEVFPDRYQSSLYEVYKGYQKYVFLTGNLFEKENDFIIFLKEALWQHYAIRFPEKVLNETARKMFLFYNEVMFRQSLVDWLIEAGYENIKLWGNGWINDSKYAKYAMGAAENGETLSKIYQASKIVVGNNCHSTSAARAWESMLSGAFYMSNFVPPEEDFVDIRKIMKVEEELVMFHGKKDFLNKVEYYLTHEEERERMAEIGHKAALERMTYDILMKRVIKELPERLKLLEQGEKTDG